ncbi:hypothetical protein CLU79DRAFT_755443 [Phycomyces nitens]|nr:hypothetical protein CLU79DRAFT_755443 [Phycomyces nitens]
MSDKTYRKQMPHSRATNSEFMSSQGPQRTDASYSHLSREQQQLREEIARLRQEEQQLCEKDVWVKKNIVAVREQMNSEDR